MNNGNGTFAPVVGYSAGTPSVINGSNGIISGDINNDGNQDLFVTNQSEIFTLLGLGNGSFAVNPSFIIANTGASHGGPLTGCLAAGHFNSDSYTDFAYATASMASSSAIAVVFGTASGSVTAPVYYPGSDQFSTADFNNDGRMDIGTAANILLGSPSGTFAIAATYSFPTQAWGVAAGNFNGDALPDLVVQTAGTLFYLHGIGNGYFSNITMANIPSGFCTFRAADLNGDLKTDVVTAGNPSLSYSVTTLLNSAYALNSNAFPPTICNGSTSTLSVFGALPLTYTWTGGSTAGSIAVAPSVTTIYTVVSTGTNACSVTQTLLVTVNTPTLQITANPSLVCPGAVSTLSVTGANTYTWTLGLATTPSISVTPLSNSVFSVAGTNAMGCTAIQTVQVGTYFPPVMNIQSPSVLCTGNSMTLIGTGASTYTWLPSLATSAQIVLAPTISTCYTLLGSSIQNCTASAVACVSVVPLPVITVAGSGSLCLGSALTLTASGALTYSWSGGPASAQIVISPSANTCYTVTGLNTNACQSFTTHCVSLINPTAAISPPQQTVCAGSSANFSVSPALSYTWSTGSNLNILNFLSSTNTVVTVSITAVNGCTALTTASLGINNLCSMVWPGDANSDGLVNASDILELGLWFSSNGPARLNASNSYSAQFSTNWTGTVTGGANRCHADCDGNGLVGLSDTLAIYNNFGLPHQFKSSALSTDSFKITKSTPGLLEAGKWNSLFIQLGSSLTSLTIYGTAFQMVFDNSIMETDSVRLHYPQSFINSGNQNLQFRKLAFNNNILHCATVRTDQNNVNGQGNIAIFSFKLRPDLQNGSQTSISLNHLAALNASGEPLQIADASIDLEISNPIAAISEERDNPLILYPNPANGRIQVLNHTGVFTYTLMDMAGSVIKTGQCQGKQQIDLTELMNGVYFFKLSNGSSEKRQLLAIFNE